MLIDSCHSLDGMESDDADDSCHSLDGLDSDVSDESCHF